MKILEVLIPFKDGIKVGEYAPDVFLVLEVGRELQLPPYMENVLKVRAVKALTPQEIPEVAKRLHDELKKIPLDKKVALVLSGPLALSALFFAFQGIHRPLAVGQFNPGKGDYDWFLIDPEGLRNFFLI
ncbi:MAG: hypothetical protein QXS76_00095 [Candidatus Bathyarchaeia archaeon]